MPTNTGKFYREIEDYVNYTVAAFATPINNIESIRCVRQNDEIFMELVHEDSCARYFRLTGLDISGIGILVGRIIANRSVDREFRNREEKKRVRKLFKTV